MRRSYKPRLAISTIMMLLLTMTIVLSSGTAAYPAASYKWNKQESGTTAPIHDVVAIDAAHVWAVTGNSELQLLFFNGSSWSAQASGISEPLYAIDAVDNNNIWAVGYNSTILHYNGSSWNPQDSGTTDVTISAVSALDPSHVWAAGGSGKIFFYDGSSWTIQPVDPSVSFESIYALDTSHVWAVGGGYGARAGHGVAFFFDGTAWSEVDTGAGSTLFDVFAMDAQHVWAVGGRGEIRFFNGSSWSGQASNTDVILYGVTALGGHAWAVGEQGTILYSEDSRTWTTSSSGVTNVLRSISGLDSQHLWAVGDDGVILSAELMPAPPFTPTARIWGHDSIGVTAPATAWYLAEGSTGKNELGSFETWVLVQNPNPNNVDVDLTFMTLSGVVAGPKATVPANSRMTFNVADYVPNTFDVSTTVESSGPTGANGVIVERAMYGDAK